MNKIIRDFFLYRDGPKPTPVPLPSNGGSLEALAPLIGKRIRDFLDGPEESPAPPEESPPEPEPIDQAWQKFLQSRPKPAEPPSEEEFKEAFFKELCERFGAGKRSVYEMNEAELRQAIDFTNSRIRSLENE